MDIKRDWPFEIISLVWVLAASAAGWLMFKSCKVSAGVLAGGLIGIINFRWLGSIVKGVFTEGSKAGYTVKYLLKFLFTITSLALLIYSRIVDPLAFLVGFTIIVAMVSLQGTKFTGRSR